MTSATMQVGKPKSLSIADAARSTATIAANPIRTSLPAFVNGLPSSRFSMVARSSFRKIHRSTRKVTTMDNKDGTVNDSIQRPSGGMLFRKTTRFAGFEIGSTKEAAFAMNAHTYKYGSGATRAFRTAARIAGV